MRHMQDPELTTRIHDFIHKKISKFPELDPQL
jgi:hypothetical protein